MLNKNDFHYILRRFIVFILISIAMFIIGIWKANALTLNVDVQKNRDVTMSGGNMNYNFGLYSNNNNEYTQKSVLFTQDITCNTSMCALEFYTANTCTFETHDNGQGTTTMNVNITAINSELAMNYGYPNCTTSGNTISCLVNNNSRTIGLTLYFGNSNLNTGVTPSMVTSSSCRGYIKDTYSIYDVPESVSNAIQQNTQTVQETNNTIKDSNVDTNSASSTFSDLDNQMASNGTISSLLTMPITLLQKLLSGLSGNCSAYPIGEIFDYNMSIECIQPTQYIGSTLWNIIDVVCAGFIAYKLGKRFVVIFNDITNLKDGGLDSAYD